MSDSEAKAFIQEVWGLQGTAYFVVGLRYYTKLKIMGWHKFSWDDFIMFLAVLTYTAESVMAYLVVAYWKGLANNAMTDEQRATLDPNSEEWYLRVSGSKTHVVGLLLYTTLLWLLKSCWLVYYSRLTDGVNNMRQVILWGAGIIATTYISCLLVAFLKCIPFNHQWQINPSPGNHCMPAISSIQTIYVMIMNSLTDFYLMGIPIPVVWKSHLPWKKKVALLVMFSGGLLEMVFGIMRCVSILTLGDIDPAQSGYWSVRESFVSVVLTNMPMIHPLFKKFIDKSRSLSRSKGTSQGESRGYKLGSIPGRELTGKRSKPSYSIPNETTWGSKEHIVSERDHGGASSGKDTSLDLPKHQTSGASRGEKVSKRPSKDDNRILVTTEYTVTEDTRNSSSREEF
ncbi:uncharacterized protein F4822DRAFT_401579 [Hypoxylon trugodes]|uniref:uncharacterized protein n=1 Tax=Hypoxylon trugodes TaxID=326681 RepID=UPI002192BD92|nr:uncharacterized protein F4822DRAFT_401579 [Hypoxylon trugodes]KAI1390336.1 hypothetical protein F4822DRAFT_401579 [Hypoxylon trugodes]